MIEKETKKDITEISGAIVSFIIIILSLFALYSINLPSNVGGIKSTITYFDLIDAHFNIGDLSSILQAILILYSLAFLCAIISLVLYIVSMFIGNEKVLNVATFMTYLLSLVAIVASICVAVSISDVSAIEMGVNTTASLKIGVSAILVPLLGIAMSLFIIILKYVVPDKNKA